MSNKNNKLKKIVLVTIIVLFIALISILIILSNLYKEENNNQNSNISIAYEDLKTVEDVINYYKCTYISQKLSEESNYDYDIELEFSKLLYEDDKKNEEFYEKIINDIAKVLNYYNFRLLDEKNDIKIEVICEDGRVYNVIINGIEDYFIYMDSQIGLREYKNIKTTYFSIDSQILNDAINTNWSKDINLGTKDSIYDSYNIYFDEGVKVRNLDSRIFNIIFTKKYTGTVVNGITPGTNLVAVKQNLGKPTFEDTELNVIGYKSDYFYIFFTEEEISIYRLEKAEMVSFYKLVDEFLEDKIDFLELMNELTYIWPDYSEYDYSAEKVFLSYPHKGLDVKINYDNTTAIIFYNNFNSELSTIEEYLEKTEFLGLLQIDNVFEAEKRRLLKIKEEKENLQEYKKENIEEGYVSSIYDCYPEVLDGYIVKLRFIAKNDNFPNREVNDTMNEYLWLNDQYLIFSKRKKGIYLYDVYSGLVSELIIGIDDFKLHSFQNGVLKYDNVERFIEL